MGKFIYEGGVKVEVEDRALTHLQLVISAKLRRGEPFAFSWREDASVGGGRTTVWMHPGSSLVYKYYGGRQPSINMAWVDALAFTANAPAGLYLVPEPNDPGPDAAGDNPRTGPQLVSHPRTPGENEEAHSPQPAVAVSSTRTTSV